MVSSDPPMVRVGLSQNPSIWVEGQDQPIAIRGLGRVLLYLLLLNGESANRTGLARVLWPGEPDEVASNRLRVSLSRIKAIFGSAYYADRRSVRLCGVAVRVDLADKLIELQEAFDEVDPDDQFRLLKGFADDFRDTSWRDFEDLDSSGVIREWDSACRSAISRMMDLALQEQDWDTVDLAWDLMTGRSELNQPDAERLLDAFSARGSVEEGMRKIRAAAAEAGILETDALFLALKKYSRTLKESGQKQRAFQSAHFSLLGAALLDQMELHAEGLGSLLALPEVQMHMQSVPTVYLQILEAAIDNLKPASPTWIEVQAARLSVYGTIYDHEGVFEVCKALFACELTPLRASMTRLHYSFSLFHLRRWREAMTAIHQAQQLAKEAGDESKYEVCLITEAAYLWHLGRVTEAREIYDAYLAKHADSKDFSIRVNELICRMNYAVIELVFGDLQDAKRHVDYVYGERTRMNLSRVMPNLLCLMSVIYARSGDLARAVTTAVDGLKLTFARSSSREGQLNMEWACGVLVVGGLKAEAWQVMTWVNEWRKETQHTRSVCEERFAESLNLQMFEGTKPMFSGSDSYREVTRFLIKCLRRVQNLAVSKPLISVS